MSFGIQSEQFCSLGLEKVLIRLKLATREEIRPAGQSVSSSKVISKLADSGVFDLENALDKIAKSLGLRRIHTEEFERDRGDWVDKVDLDVLKQHCCLPLSISSDKKQLVAFADPLDRSALSAMEFVFGGRIEIAVARESDIMKVLNDRLGSSDLAMAMSGADASDIGMADARVSNLAGEDVNNILQGSESAPVVRLVNQIISDAFSRKASDIHVEPSRESLQIKFRIDGVVVPQLVIPKRLQTYLTTRLKLMAKMDITERRRPQDGRFRVRAKAGTADIRVSSVPTPFGEKIVMRVLDSDVGKLRLELLGLDDDILARLKECLTARDRLILVSGPTGSGKSTTLYSAIQSIKDGSSTIVTVEDPIEYSLQDITQIQVNAKIGMTFASCLRSIMRQDPDVILLGEIRDTETAQIAFQAAQTGHLVLTTLHTNSAVGSIVRLRDLGLEPYLIAPSLGAILAQRLVRRLCESCAQAEEESKKEEFRQQTGLASDNVRRSIGCNDCHGSGFRGRVGVYSLLVVDRNLRELIRTSAGEESLVEAARNNGMLTLSEAGVQLVARGVSTLEEVERVIGAEETNLLPRAMSTPVPDSNRADQKVVRSGHGDAELGATDDPFSTLEDLKESFVVSGSSSGSEDSDITYFDFESGRDMTSGSIEDLVASHNGIASLGVKKPTKVLFVDDDSGVRAVMVRALQRADFEVREACDGLDAMTVLENFTPDVVVSDLVMPRLDGQGLVEKIRSSAKYKELPVIVLTGSDTQENEVKLLKAGANDFVSKGSSPAVVIARITRLLKID